MARPEQLLCLHCLHMFSFSIFINVSDLPSPPSLHPSIIFHSSAHSPIDFDTHIHACIRTYIISINPELDIGQVHGAFVMGLGYWLMEEAKFDAETGQLLTHNTWVSCLVL